jgi:hypothetical protein
MTGPADCQLAGMFKAPERGMDGEEPRLERESCVGGSGRLSGKAWPAGEQEIHRQSCPEVQAASPAQRERQGLMLDCLYASARLVLRRPEMAVFFARQRELTKMAHC